MLPLAQGDKFSYGLSRRLYGFDSFSCHYGQVATPLIGKDGFQEADVVGITVPVTKHNYQVRDVNHVSQVVQEAFTSPKADDRPVLIDIPKDVQNAKVTSFFNEEVDIPGTNQNLYQTA